MLSSKYTARIVLGCVLAVLFKACNNLPAPDGTPDPNATTVVIQPTIFATIAPTQPPSPSATPEPTATPLPLAPVAIPLIGAIDTLHPFYAVSPSARAVLGALFVGCIGPDETQVPVALGCEQVPTAENGGAVFVGEGVDRFLQATFKIKSGWRWTDGKPVTAQDAIYAWQLIMSPESGLRDATVQQVYSMAAPDERTLVVSFMSAAQAQAAALGALRGDVPFEYFTQVGDYAGFAAQETPLAPKDYWSVVRWLPSHLMAGVAPRDQVNTDWARKPVGDGAFELAEIDQTHLLLRPAAAPFVLGAPAITGIDFRIGTDAAAIPASSPLVQIDGGAQPIGNNGAVSYTASVEQLVFNVDRFPLDDVKVRQAAAFALQLDALGQDPNTTAVVPASVAHDPARAAALLAEAGWVCDSKPCQKAITDDNGNTITRTLTFKLTTTEREPRNVISQAIQKQLADVGFAVDVEIVFGAGRQSRMFASYEDGGVLLTRNFDAALYQVAAPLSIFGQFACASVPTDKSHDVSKGNASGFCDADVDALLQTDQNGEAVVTSQRGATQAQALAKIQQAAPVVPLYEVKRVVQTRGVSGVRPGSAVPVTWNAWEWR